MLLPEDCAGGGGAGVTTVAEDRPDLKRLVGVAETTTVDTATSSTFLPPDEERPRFRPKRDRERDESEESGCAGTATTSWWVNSLESEPPWFLKMVTIF